MYSSRTPGRRRERKTVTSMAVFPCKYLRRESATPLYGQAPVGASSLLLEFRHLRELGDPRPRRAPPILPLRRQPVALAQLADPNGVGRLYAIARRRRI